MSESHANEGGGQGGGAGGEHTAGSASEAAAAGAVRSFGERLLGALKLDASVYEEVEHDTSAMGQAAGVVGLAAVAQWLASPFFPAASVIAGSLLAAFAGWALATAIVWVIGVKWFEHTSDYGELLRTLGFANAPALLLAIGVIPLGPFLGVLWIVVYVLLLVAFVVAVRQALDVSTGRSILVCVLALIANALLVAGLQALVT